MRPAGRVFETPGEDVSLSLCLLTFPGGLRLRLPDVLERLELSLNLVSKLVSLILEKHLLSLNIFRRP